MIDYPRDELEIHSSILGPLVARLRRQFRINYFYESGTCHGDTAELAAIMFDKVFTCEIDSSLVAESTERLAPYNNVMIAQMESPAFLRKIKRQLSQPTMFWLDGHWCGGPVKPAKECPLLEELEVIGRLRHGGNGHSVVLADEANYMVQPPPPPHDPAQWPTMDQIRQVVAGWDEEVTMTIEQGPRSQILAITPEKYELSL